MTRVCTCKALGRYREVLMEVSSRDDLTMDDVRHTKPDECRIHPVQTIMGDVRVSTIMRESSARYAPGWYEETMVFQIVDGEWQPIDQCAHHFEGVRKHFGGDIAVYEAGWREVSDERGHIHAIDVADAMNRANEDDDDA